MRIAGGMLGAKSITLGDLDDLMDAVVDGKDATAQQLYAAVAWTFWAVNRRANNISNIPWVLYPMDLAAKDETAENTVDTDIILTSTLWAVEAWLQLTGTAYAFKRTNEVRTRSLQVLNANTMRIDPKSVTVDGPQRFIQRLPGKPDRVYTADEILYFFTWSPRLDFGPGVAPGGVGARASEIVLNSNQWVSSFFKNGAIPSVMLTTDGPVPPLEKTRLREAWDKMLSGVFKFKTVVLERGLKPTIIGQPIKDLAMPDLDERSRNQIVASHGIPPGLADTKTNRAERDALQYEFYDQDIIPWTEANIATVLNDGLFNPEGNRIKFQFSAIEAVQREEIKKAESMAFAINGVALPAFEANVVSVDETRRTIDAVYALAGLPLLDTSFTPEVRTPVQAFGASATGEGPGANTPPGQNVGTNTRPKALAPPWGLPQVSLEK